MTAAASMATYRRAPLDAARLRPLARAVSRGGSAAHQDAALRPPRLSLAVLSSAAPDRGNLHARSDERRAARARDRTRRVAVRDSRLRPRFRADRRNLSRGLRTHPQGPCLRQLDLRGQALPISQRADDPAAAAAPASAVMVRHHYPRERGL